MSRREEIIQDLADKGVKFVMSLKDDDTITIVLDVSLLSETEVGYLVKGIALNPKVESIKKHGVCITVVSRRENYETKS